MSPMPILEQHKSIKEINLVGRIWQEDTGEREREREREIERDRERQRERDRERDRERNRVKLQKEIKKKQQTNKQTFYLGQMVYKRRVDHISGGISACRM